MTRYVLCSESHGRTLWIGHWACTACGHIYKRKPETVCGCGKLEAGADPYEHACAQCYAAQQQSGGYSSVQPTYSEGHAGINFT